MIDMGHTWGYTYELRNANFVGETKWLTLILINQFCW